MAPGIADGGPCVAGAVDGGDAAGLDAWAVAGTCAGFVVDGSVAAIADVTIKVATQPNTTSL